MDDNIDMPNHSGFTPEMVKLDMNRSTSKKFNRTCCNKMSIDVNNIPKNDSKKVSKRKEPSSSTSKPPASEDGESSGLNGKWLYAYLNV